MCYPLDPLIKVFIYLKRILGEEKLVTVEWQFAYMPLGTKRILVLKNK